MGKGAGKSRGKKSRAEVIRFDVPFALDRPPLTNLDLGIDRFVQRGRDHTYTTDITVLDTFDHRLNRSGVLLAHRVCDGLGDWYLSAQGWESLLPAELSLPVDAEGDLPEQLASLVRPLRRLLPLGPVAAITLERAEYSIRSDLLVLGTLRDDKFTIRRGGVAIGRVREVTIRPTNQLTRAQREHLVATLLAAGGARVREFPDVRGRIGAPATGLTDFPTPRPAEPTDTLERLVMRVFAARLRAILAADLAARQADPAPAGHTHDLVDQLGFLDAEVRGLSGVLEPQWRSRFEEAIAASLADGQAHADQGLLTQHAERYLEVLDQLVAATRAPKLGDAARRPASSVLRQLIEAQSVVVFDRCDQLSEKASDERWTAAATAAARLHLLIDVSLDVCGDKGQRLSARAHDLADALAAVAASPISPSDADLAELSAPAAFGLGRRFQAELDASVAARSEFVASWRGRRGKLAKVMVRP